MDPCSSATVFKTVGFENPTAVSHIVAGTNFIMTVNSHLAHFHNLLYFVGALLTNIINSCVKSTVPNPVLPPKSVYSSTEIIIK